MTRTKVHPYARREPQIKRKISGIENLIQSAGVIQDCVNAVQMLFSKMKDSLMDLLTPSWLSDILADLHVSRPPDTDTGRSALESCPKTYVSEHRSSGIQQDQIQEEPRPPDLICQDEGQGQMMSIPNQEDEFLALESVHRSAELPQSHEIEMTDHAPRTDGFISDSNWSHAVGRRSLSWQRSLENKRKMFDHEEKASLWKKQKTDRQKLYEVMPEGNLRENLRYKQPSRVVLADGNARNSRVFPAVTETIDVKSDCSWIGKRKFVTDSTSRRILDVIDKNPKPLYMIIPDLQMETAAPKLKYFVPTPSHGKKTITSNSQSSVNTGITSARQYPVNTSITSVKQSPVNSSIKSARQSPVNTSITLTLQSPVNTRITSAWQSPVNTRITSAWQSPVNTRITSAWQSPVNTSIASARQSPVNTSIASFSKSQVNTSITLVNKLPVNTSITSISHSQLNTSKFPVNTSIMSVSKSSVNTSITSISPLSVNTSITAVSQQGLKFQPVEQGLNFQPNKALTADGDSVTQSFMFEEATSSSTVFKSPRTMGPTTIFDHGTSSSSAVSKSPLTSEGFDHGTSSSSTVSRSPLTSVPTTKSDHGTNSPLISNFTSPFESKFEAFVKSREDTMPSQSYRQDAASCSVSGNKFLSTTASSNSALMVPISSSNSSTILASSLAPTSSTEFAGSSFQLGSTSSFAGPSVITAGQSFTSASAIYSTTPSLISGSSPVSCSSSELSYGENASLTPENFTFDLVTSSQTSKAFTTKSTAITDNILSESQGLNSGLPVRTEYASSLATVLETARAMSSASKTTISSTTQSSLFSSEVSANSTSSFASKPSDGFVNNRSETSSSKFDLVTPSSSVPNSRSRTTNSSMLNSNAPILESVIHMETLISDPDYTRSVSNERLSRSGSPTSRSANEPFVLDSSITALVSSEDTIITSSRSPAVTNEFGGTSIVDVPASETVVGSRSNTLLEMDMPRSEDMNINALVTPMSYQRYHQSDSETTEEFSSNVSIVSPSVGDTPLFEPGDITARLTEVAVLETKIRPDDSFKKAIGQGDAEVMISRARSPQDSAAFHEKPANNLIDHASCLIPVKDNKKSAENYEVASRLPVKPDMPRLPVKPDMSRLPVEPDMQTMNGRNKNQERRHKIKRLPEDQHKLVNVDTVTMETSEASEEVTIPEPICPPEPEQIPENVKFQKVFCDIETSSLSMCTEIVQIAAVCEDETFDQYILPQLQMEPRASTVTGLTCDGGVLYHHGTAVRTLDLKSALERFLGWLRPLGPCILVGHNFKNFDYPRIYRAFSKFNLINAFHQIVVGFVDSYPLFKAIYPNEKSYKQESLVGKFVKETYDAHNAVGDVKSLKKLFAVSDKITHELLCMYSYTITWYVEYHKYKAVSNKNAKTFKPVILNKILSKSTVDKIAGSGLEMQHLKLTYVKEGPDSLTELLVSRASVSKATVGKLLTYLASK